MNRRGISTLHDAAELSRDHRIFYSEIKRLPVSRLVLWLLEWNVPIVGQCLVFTLDFLCFIKTGEKKKEKCDEELLLISVETVAGTVSGWCSD